MNLLKALRISAVIIPTLIVATASSPCWGEASSAVQNEPLSREANIEFNAAVNLQNTNRADEALKKFESVLKKHPNSGVAESGVGTMLLKLGREREAIPHLERAFQLDPTTNTIGNLGVALMDVGDNNRARELLEKEVRRNPDDAKALGNLISANISIGNLEDALKYSAEFVRRFPAHEGASEIRGNQKLIQEQLAQRRQHASDVGEPDYYAELGQNVCTWAKSRIPIKVYISPGSGVPHFLPEFDNALIDAFTAWQSATRGTLSFKFVDSPKEADINCYWVADPKQLRGGTEQGLATLARDGDHIASAKIDLLTTPIGNHGYAVSTVSLPVMRLTCLHEVGHALGMVGHSTHADDAMYFSEIGTESVALSQRDTNTIRRIYQ